MKAKSSFEQSEKPGICRIQILKIGFAILVVAFLTSIFGIMGCKDSQNAAMGNKNIPLPQVLNFVAESNGKVYHKMTCKNKPYKGKLVYFDSPVAAQQAGYKPCSVCKPDKI